MGEAKLRQGRRSRDREEVLAGEPRCIYCNEPHNSLEHMPPISMFTNRDRPSGLEFATCLECNNGTRGADVVAAMIARIRRMPDIDDPLLRDAFGYRETIQTRAPGVWEELVDPARRKQGFVRTPGGFLRLAVEIMADGPRLRAHLNVFSAKLGMALYREHAGQALPLDGMVMSAWFLNAGLSQDYANTVLAKLPEYDGLRQGKKTSEGQFAYRYNSDEKTTVSALSQFHDGLHVFNIATCMPELYNILSIWPDSTVSKPGGLIGMLPEPPRLILHLG